MLRATWRTSIRPPFIPPLMVMGTAALITLAAAQLAVAAPLFRTSSAADCSTSGAAARAMGRHVGAAPAVTQKLDARGEFIGRGLAFAGRAATALPVDSFVGPPGSCVRPCWIRPLRPFTSTRSATRHELTWA